VGLTPEELEKQIKEARAKQEQETGTTFGLKKIDPNSSTTGKAVRVTSELAAALIVGGVLGFWLDKWLNTKPMFMIVLFFAGFVAGFLNIYRSQSGPLMPAQKEDETGKKDKQSGGSA